MPTADQTPIRADVPLGMHPDSLLPLAKSLEVEKTIGASAYSAARSALKLCYEGFSRINDAEGAVRDVSPRVTHRPKQGGSRTEIVMNYDDLAAAASKALASISPGIDRRMAELKSHRDKLAHRVSAALDDPQRKTPEGLSLADAVRRHVKDLSEPKRLQFLANCIDNGDLATASAVLHAQPFLSGLDARTQELLRERAAHKFAPQERAQLEAVETAIDRVQRAGAGVIERFSKIIELRESAVGKAQTAVKKLAVGSP